MMSLIDLDEWVKEAKDKNKIEIEFRKAIKSILDGISQEDTLASLMVMKGGLLLAVKYRSPRFTRDIDFSTNKTLQEVDIEDFTASLERGIDSANENEYGLVFALQKKEIKPSVKTNPSFPTLHLKIGFADRNDKNQYNRLAQKQSAKVVEIDFSFNEWIDEDGSEVAVLQGHGELKHYSLHEIVAEKIRSVLQQIIRDRSRYQDIYDLNLLLEMHEELRTENDRKLVLSLLKKACESRNVPCDIASFSNPEIKERCREGYEQELPDQLTETPPPFEESFSNVDNYYSSLPWQENTEK